MAGASAFDQWQKDVFFSAAEEVQESADIMESMYRMWTRDQKDVFNSYGSDELYRELHTALGTAKWQLEEFEKAVSLSYGSHSPDKSAITRHRQFITAIEDKISNVEKALRDSLIEEGKQPLRWVQLDEEERDDLAAFLSSVPQTSQEGTSERHSHDVLDVGKVRAIPGSISGFKGSAMVNKDAKYVDKAVVKETLRSKDNVLAQREELNGRRTCSSPDMGDWKIVINGKEDATKRTVDVKPETPKRPSSICGFLKNVEPTTKSSLFRNSFPKAKTEERHQLKQGLPNFLTLKGVTWFSQGINGINDRSRSCLPSYKDSKVSKVQQLVRKVSGLQRHFQGSHYLIQYGHSVRVTLLLVLTIFLVVPFVLYST